MNTAQDLLTHIAEAFSIERGEREDEQTWKRRLLYSLCGRTGYAALWDAGGADVSIQAVRRRIETILQSCSELYPDAAPAQADVFKEIYRISEATGLFYHQAYNVRPAAPSAASVGAVTFFRGESPHTRVCVSGLGSYRRKDSSENEGSIYRMFQMEEMPLSPYWEKMTQAIALTCSEQNEGMDFLREQPSYTDGYWTKQPYRHGQVSLLRQGQGDKRYHFYRYENGALYMSAPIPSWLAEDWRQLGNACLHARGTLPPIRYRMDGAIVHLHLGYLLPCAELNFLKLYSWPEEEEADSDFRHICTREIFDALLVIFGARGFSFKEE